jgi:hypothetical protein
MGFVIFAHGEYSFLASLEAVKQENNGTNWRSAAKAQEHGCFRPRRVKRQHSHNVRQSASGSYNRKNGIRRLRPSTLQGLLRKAETKALLARAL